MDGPVNCATCTYSLQDFFNFNTDGYHAFQTIEGAKYLPSCFHMPKQTGCFPNSYPQDLDDDEIESSQ